MQSKEILLRSRPVGMPKAEDFELTTRDVPEPASGQVRVRNLCMSVDPYMRGRMIDQASYVPPFQLGETLTGGAIGQVVDSAHPDFAPGDHVQSMYGWREAFTCDGGELQKLGTLHAPASAYLGVLGMPGMTAYFGLLDVGRLQDGETVFVSGAAGAVGSIVGQIAKIRGCRVLGSAGSAAKVDWLRNTLGFDHAFDYHEGDLLGQLQRGAPQGIDVYFDNVGGDHLQAAIAHMKPFGRLPLCGMISQYNNTEPAPGPNNLVMAVGKQLTLQGFIVSSFMGEAQRFYADMGPWVADGRIRYQETVHDGVEQAPEAFMGLFKGANTGKMVVRLSDG